MTDLQSFTLMMASVQVIESSVNTNNSPSQEYTTNPNDHSNQNIKCTLCSKLYTGKSGRKLGDCFCEHLLDVKSKGQTCLNRCLDTSVSQAIHTNAHPVKPSGGPSGGRKFRTDTKVKSSFNYPWGHSLTELVLGISRGSWS